LLAYDEGSLGTGVQRLLSCSLGRTVKRFELNREAKAIST